MQKPVLLGFIAWSFLFITGCFSDAAVSQSSPPQVTQAVETPTRTEIDWAHWPAWRGPANGIAASDQQPPLEFGLEQNLLWKAEVPGRGHSSPVIADGKIFLTTSDMERQTQSVLAFDRDSGERLWVTEVNHGAFNPQIHPSNTHASSTVATCEGRAFAIFNNHDGVQLVCLDFDGNIVWEKQAGKFMPLRYQFGFGSSPVIFGDAVIVSAESEREGFLAAFDQKTGDERWRVKRTGATSYSTPLIQTIDSRYQLILSGGRKVTGYDPTNGEILWEVDGPWEVTCGTAVCHENIVVVSGGYPVNRTMAIRVEDKGAEVIWENAHKCYEQSLLAHDGYAYGLTDQGFAICLRMSDGEEMWRERLSQPTSASPALVGRHLYLIDERGGYFVIAADPAKYEVLASNQLGDISYATPAILGGRIYTRIATRSGGAVQEWLVCLGQE